MNQPQRAGMLDKAMTCLIKICGITTVDDARSISRTGIDYLGVLVNVARSPRSVRVERASAIIAASSVPVIVLTYDQSPDETLAIIDKLQPAAVQLAGREGEHIIATLRERTNVELWKSVHLPTQDSTPCLSGELTARINRLAEMGIGRFILDTTVSKGAIQLRGGTGQQCDWTLASQIKNQVDAFLFLAGGINPYNVCDALRQVNPDGIDVSSGVEDGIGKKDPDRVTYLVAQVRKEIRNTP